MRSKTRIISTMELTNYHFNKYKNHEVQEPLPEVYLYVICYTYSGLAIISAVVDIDATGMPWRSWTKLCQHPIDQSVSRPGNVQDALCH